MIGQNEEIEENEDNVEVEEFEEIEDEEEETGVENEIIESFPLSARNVEISAPVNIEPTVRIANNQRVFVPNYDEFDEKSIKKYCLESGTITQLPLMSVIRKIEFFIQITE